jgi:hypothetical protein
MTGNRVEADTDMKQAATSYTKTLETDFLHPEIQSSPTQWDEVNGDYMKMWWVPSATHASWVPRNWKKILDIILLVKLIFEKSLHTYRLQYLEISDSLLIKNHPFFLCFMLVFFALEFNIKVITFKNCALDDRDYADIKKRWDV